MLPDQEVQRFSLFYFALVCPVILFVAVNLPKIISRQYSSAAFIVLLWFGIVTLISLPRLDINSIYSVGLFCLVLIIVFNAHLAVGVTFINRLFVLSVIACIITTHIGTNEYGYIPAEFLGSRVSLFPRILESALFSSLVIIVNYLNNTSKYRWFFILAAGYFVAFSGSRTTYLVIVFFTIFIAMTKFASFRDRSIYRVFNVTAVIALLIFIYLGTLIQFLHELDSPIINRFIFKTENATVEQATMGTLSSRTWLWEQHFNIFKMNPFVGIGTFDLRDYVMINENIHHTLSTGSESFITAQFARFGIPAFLLIALVFDLQNKGLKARSRLTYFLALVFLISMLFYGSFIVPYNFLLLLLIGLMMDENRIE